MKKTIIKAAAVGAVLLTVLTFSACKKNKEEKFEVSFAVKSYEGEGVTFAIPSEWGQLADPTGSDVLVFAGEDAYESTSGFNNISVCIYDTNQPAPKLEDVKAAFEADFEAKVKETYPDATEFVYDSFETKECTVLTAGYRCTAMGKELKQKVYYPLLDNKQIYVAACDIGSGVINADEAAHQVVHTLSLEETAGKEDAGDKEEASKQE